jgi:hypothetical protein
MSPLRPKFVDPRGQRFAAWVTSFVLAAVLYTQSGWLLLAQAVIFALGAFIGMGASPYGVFFRYVVAPRLGPSPDREATPPLRFAQALGFGFSVIGTIGFLAGSPALGTVAAAAALIAAFLNAAFGLCLGCLVYLRGRLLINRLTRSRTTAESTISPTITETTASTHKGVSV